MSHAFIRASAMGMRDNPDLTTRLAFPPRVELQTGINAFVDSFNEKMIPDNVFMNTRGGEDHVQPVSRA